MRLQQHLQNPYHPGRVERPHGEGAALNPSCGDELRLTLRVDEGRICEARFQASGCAATLAAGSVVTGMLEGLHVQQVALCVTPEAIEEALGGLPPQRRHAAVLASQAAVRAASAIPGQEFA